MTHPIYKFNLTARGVTQDAFPIYGNDLAVEYEKETNQEFYRAKLGGKLTFVKGDFDFIMSQIFGTKISVAVYVSRNAGQTWTPLWDGYFYLTDCEVDEDAGKISVTPTANDSYEELLGGLDKECNLIDLAPEIREIQADKRPLIQVYTPGDSVIGCFLSGMWWEQECEPETNENRLVNHFHFAKNVTKRVVDIVSRNVNDPVIPDVFFGNVFDPINDATYENDGYYFVWDVDPTGGAYQVHSEIRDGGDPLWEMWMTVNPGDSIIGLHEYTPVEGSAARNALEIEIRDVSVFIRMLTDALSSTQGVSSSALPDDDLVADNRNYSRVCQYNISGLVHFSSRLSSTPTKWGLYKTGQYYVAPSSTIYPQLFKVYPIARSAWSALSLWFSFSTMDWAIEESWRKSFVMKDCYPIVSVISNLLKQFAPNIKHTYDDSIFLYFTNPIDSQYKVDLFLTPKSNVINAGYDQPAQKAMITLRQVLDMLRNVYQCYWRLITRQDGLHLQIEHIKFFRNGGSYSTSPSVGVDLTQQIVTRNGLPWAYDTKKYQYDKPDMASRYQFKWMDDVTELFDGLPIDITSAYVNPEKMEEVAVENITSDLDYILLNPAAVSEEGFVLIAARLYGSGIEQRYYKVEYLTVTIDSVSYVMQNGYASFYYAETTMYGWDMPARIYTIGGDSHIASGVKRLKWQNVEFPLLSEPDLTKLVKTSLGNGTIRKLSLSLTSRNAKTTLCYDTQ